MAIQLVTGLNITNNSPVDLKLLQATTASRDAIPSYQRYIGMTVFVTGSNELYRLQGGITNTNWVLLEQSSSYSATASYALNSTGGGTSLSTGSTYPITSSWAEQAITASFALNAGGGGMTLTTGSDYPITSSWSHTASFASESYYAESSNTSNFAVLAGNCLFSASYANLAGNADTSDFSIWAGNTLYTSSYANTSSYSITASYALNAGGGGTTLSTGSTYPITSSWSATASYALNASGDGTSLNTGSTYPITSSWAISSSFATTAIDALAADFAMLAGEAISSTSASYALTAMGADFAMLAGESISTISASFATSASWAPGGSGGTSLTTGSIYPITSSWSYVAESSSYALTSSWAINAINGGTQLTTGSTYPITSSWAMMATTTSYFDQLWINTGSSYPITSSWALSASTSSYYNQLWLTTGSIYPITSSWAISSSHAAYAINAETASLSNTASSINFTPQTSISSSWALTSNTSSYLTGSGQVIDPTTPGDITNKRYVDNINQQGLEFYFRSSSSDIDDYRNQQRLDTPLSSTAYDLIVNNASASQYVYLFVSPALNVDYLQSGNVNTNFSIYRVGGAVANTIIPELYLRSGSVERLIGTSTAMQITPDVASNNISTATLTASLSMSLSDRLVTKFRMGNATNTPNIHFLIEGQSAARITVPIPSSNFVLRTGDTMVGTLTGPGYIGTSSYANQALSASYSPPQSSASASWASSSYTASYLTGERIYTSGYALTGSYINYQTASYVLTNNDDGRMLCITSGSTTNVAISGSILLSTFSCTVFQSGSGQIAFTTSSNSVLRNRAGHIKMAGQYAMASLVRVVSGDFILSGDTAS